MKRFVSFVVAFMLIITSISVAYATDSSVIDTKATSDVLNQLTENIPEKTEPDYPVITSFSTASNGIKISWEPYPNAVKYRLFVRRNNSWNTIAITSDLSYTHTGLYNNTEYLYTLRAVDSDGNFVSKYNKDGFACTYLQSPVMKQATPTTDGMKVTWNAVEGAKNYKVYVKTSSAWKAIGYTTETSFLDTNVVSANTYTYTVRCVSEDGKLFTSHHTSGIKATYIATPQITKVENTATGTKVSWTKVAGATKYRLFYKVSGGWKTIANTTSTSYTHAPLSNQATYTYTVRALNSKNQYISAYNSTGTTNTFLSVPVLKSASSVYGGMKVTWDAVQGADKYKVYVKTASSWKALGTTDSTSFVDTTATSSKSHTYTVRCVANDGSTWTSYFDKKGVTGTYVASPVITKTESTATGTQITWNYVAGANKYKVFYKTPTSWQTIATTTSNTYTHQPLSDSDTYIYTVRACNAKGSYISGYDSVGTNAKFVAPIKLNYGLNANSNPLLSWSKEDTAYGYRIYRKTLSGSWTKIADITGTTFIDKNPPKNTPYTYTMRCINENGDTINYFESYTKYYYNDKIADGNITYNNQTYKFSSGYLTQGFVTINNKLYYYNKNGQIEKNGIVGSKAEGYYYADKNGVCCQTKEMVLAAEFLMENATGNTPQERLKTGFSYLARNYPYLRTYDHPKKAEDMPKQAIDMFVNKKGNCFKYAAAFACMAKASGYRARVVVGTTPGFGTWTPHGWTEVYVDGKWLVSDPDFQMAHPSPAYYYYMTDGARIPIRVNSKFEIDIVDGNAIWK